MRYALLMVIINITALFQLASAVGAAPAAPADFATRRQMYLTEFSRRPLDLKQSATTWVDSERWCVAHACLEQGVRLNEANTYFATVSFVSLWQGLVADTDVQITDLLWSYFRFRASERMTPAAREHLRQLFLAWRVPNPDRNGKADQEYQWPSEYTENHSLNILAAAYLIDVACERDRTAHHRLLLEFLGDRARLGWSEFYSPSYGIVTAKVLALLAATAPDPAVADSSRMLLDILAIDFANTGLVCWRGIPYARGYGAEVNNASHSYYELARLWFGDPQQTEFTGNPFLVHVLTDGYQPPDAAKRLLADLPARGRYEATYTATHGPARLRVPIVVWVTPAITMASAQGSGSYYDGSYCSISFTSSPNHVIIARDGKQRTIFQRRNVLMTFGQVAWHGPLRKTVEGNITVGGDEQAWVAQLDLPEQCHLLLVAERADYADEAAVRQAMQALNATITDGVVTWTAPDGARVRATTTPQDGHRRLAGVTVDSEPVRLDRNLLYNTPTLRSVRDSAVIEVLDGPRLLVYDFRDPARPALRVVPNGKLTPIPAERVDGALGMRFRYIPPGEFVLGSGLNEGRANERPQRRLTLNGFYLGETEVTVGQWKAYLAANPTAPSLPDWYVKEWGKTDRHPVAWVNWQEAVAFCRWLSDTTGRAYRLPTEAEWEKAASGYTHQAYPWGDTYDSTQSGTPNGEYAPAGEHPLDVSPFGVRGMAGNVWEWCADWYAPDAYAALPEHDPTGPALGTGRVLRGCGWNFDPDTFRCSYRSRLAPTDRSVHIGFRVVLEPN